MWKIAFGNVVRHGKRSALIVLAVGMSVATMVFMSGMLDGMREDFFHTMVSNSGHLSVEVVEREGALDPFALSLLLAEWREIGDWFTRQPEAVAVEPILSFGALMVHETKNIGLIGYGVIPETRLFRDVREGIRDGRFPNSPGEIAVSEGIRELLSLEIGGPVLVLTEDATGAPYYLEYTVGGTFQSESAEFDDGAFLVHIADAQDLLYVDDDVRELRVILNDPAAAETLATRFSTELARDDVRVETWREKNRGLIVLFEMMDVFMLAINLLIVIVAATVITNAILMNVFEKTREFGMMRAIGLTRRGQFGLVMAEGASYGLVGSICGLMIGIPLVLYLQTHGIDFGAVMESFGLGRVLTFRFRPITAIMNAAFGTTVALVGSLYAASVATRLSILESLRGSN